MKKTFIFGLMAAALGFSACSSEADDILGEKTQKKGMVLNASVEQPAETRATISNTGENATNWKFAFATGDKVKVTNTEHTGYYTFTKGSNNFASTDAEPTFFLATWHAYYPSEETISLVDQPGTLEGVANLYALAGSTTLATNGKDGLSIIMKPQVAILKIINNWGTIKIQVKVVTNHTQYVTGLTPTVKDGVAGYKVEASDDVTTLFSTTTKGTYYVAVPTGMTTAIWDGSSQIDIKEKSLPGFTAGNYYELELKNTIGTQPTTINGVEYGIKWIQLWEGGPKFAECNVGFTELKAEDYGGYYTWGGSVDVFGSTGAPAYNTGTVPLTGDSDTATKLWGSKWRMPTEAELDALFEKCDVVNKVFNHVYGVCFKGKGDYAPNYLFLPYAGECINGAVDSRGNTTSSPNYWSSTPSGTSCASGLTYKKVTTTPPDYIIVKKLDMSRSNCYSVRAVLVE